MTTSIDVRAKMVSTLRRDLIGPGLDDDDLAREILPARPQRWYLTGYLLPVQAPADQRTPAAAAEGALDSGDGADGMDDADEPDTPTAKPNFLPSSMGLSFLVPEAVTQVRVLACWGDYRAAYTETAEDTPLLHDPASEAADAEGPETEVPAAPGGRPSRRTLWHRTPRRETIDLRLPDSRDELPVPDSDGLVLAVVARRLTLSLPDGPVAARSVSVFLVNRRAPRHGRRADEALVFQAALHVECDTPFIARPDPRGYRSDEFDDRLADLHYRDAAELAVGHNVSADWTLSGGVCRHICTTWIPAAIVPRIVSAEPGAVRCTLQMDALGVLADFAAARQALDGLPQAYRDWIRKQRPGLGGLAQGRRDLAEQLLVNAGLAAGRIEEGIACLAAPEVLEAFRIANRAIAAAARRREAQARGGIAPDPAWRPFQLAFLLLNLKGLDTPEHPDRSTVDLLFFPTGGGKTEAYLGLAAFTIALRRLRNPGMAGAGVTVLMRYTLRLLTLDQLQRAAGVICALELER